MQNVDFITTKKQSITEANIVLLKCGIEGNLSNILEGHQTKLKICNAYMNFLQMMYKIKFYKAA